MWVDTKYRAVDRRAIRACLKNEGVSIASSQYLRRGCDLIEKLYQDDGLKLQLQGAGGALGVIQNFIDESQELTPTIGDRR